MKELNNYLEAYKLYKEKPNNLDIVCTFFPTIEDLKFKNDSFTKDYLSKQQYAGYFILKHLEEKHEK